MKEDSALRRSRKGIGGRPATPVIDGQKRCGRCGETKDVESSFARSARNPTGFSTRCKTCDHILYEAQKNPEFVEKRRAAARAWNKDPKNREARKASKAKSDKKNRSKIRERWNARMRTDVQFRLSVQLRVRLASAMQRLLVGKRPHKVTSAVRDLGCSLQELMAYLEEKFVEGMSWLNYGKWHIDHIRPLASFDLTDPAQARLACHFTNLQPLWGVDNLRKGAKTS